MQVNHQINFTLLIYGLFVLATLVVGSANAKQYASKEAALSDEKPPTSDYEEYNDDEEMPAEQKKPSQGNPTSPSPYFNEKILPMFVTLNANVTLECPVKNYNERSQNILWYKEEIPITNGNSALSKGYRLDKNFSLIIENFPHEATGNYYCVILPQDVRHHVIVNIGVKPNNDQTTAAIGTSTTDTANTKSSQIKVDGNDANAASKQCRHFGNDYLVLAVPLLFLMQLSRD